VPGPCGTLPYVNPFQSGSRVKQAQAVAFATVAATLVLIGIGVLVRATGSGLGCPDWPTCHGGVVPPGHHHALIEFSHRLAAAVVGLLVIATAILVWRSFRDVPRVLWAAVATVPLVGFQGLLGAITVERELSPEIVATHLLTAMLVLSFELFVALAIWRQLHPLSPPAELRRTGAWALGGLAWLAAVLWVGGYLGASGASTACADWPTCNGASFLPGADEQEIAHMAHRFLAAGLAVFVAAFGHYAWRQRGRARWVGAAALGLVALYAIQVALGALNVWFEFPDALTISHTVVASLIWATFASAAILAYYVPAMTTVTERRPAGQPV